ncbi:Fur family transcriptional regulator [Microbacterium sp. NPDC077663]|uniref:Fur family transcriptional regulator n=1 Tax=Microbacterium sp. NPDC077663 TaxID=3364189 RepID=UPI0037C7101E
MTDPVTDPAAALRDAGLRVTESRLAVFAALAAHPHASAEAVYAEVAGGLPKSSRQSVYNALNDFVDASLVRRIEPAGQPMLFELRVDDNHHHLVCTSCGRVEDVECAVGAAPCLHPSDHHGFRIAVAEVTYWGLCGTCAAEAAA